MCFFCKQGLAFRGHDVSAESQNLENVLEMMDFACKNNSEIMCIRDSAPLNAKYESSDIQKDMLEAAAGLVQKAIVHDIRTAQYFTIIVDESCDESRKEQMGLCL
jgi:hypothetical protein